MIVVRAATARFLAELVVAARLGVQCLTRSADRLREDADLGHPSMTAQSAVPSTVSTWPNP